MTPIDIPDELLKAVSISWKMETNHARAESPFSGHTQAQRGQLERWSFVMSIRRLSRAEAQVAQGFFMMLEGPLGLFRMADPAASKPLGKATGNPILSTAASPGDRTIAVSGFAPNVSGILKAGDWVQIGDQLSKVRTDVASSATGTATLSLWPKVMKTVPVASPVIVRNAAGLFRFTSQPPEWQADSNERGRPYTFQLTGVQEVLTD
ncbi:MAG: hypothetical protein EOP87_24985 [Verrucomicrobiaceae bacterium]|nr:MAG: hypothetical protein EOP87_24985 [Verrucomicrobiaceae bacterium]